MSWIEFQIALMWIMDFTFSGFWNFVSVVLFLTVLFSGTQDVLRTAGKSIYWIVQAIRGLKVKELEEEADKDGK